MADPFRLRVLKALTAVIRTVTPANGYAHDLSDFVDEAGRTSARVFRGRDVFGFNDPLPLVSILEAPRPLEQLSATAGSAASKGDWEILIQAFVTDDPENPTDPAHLLIADVVKAIAAARKGNRRDLLGLGDLAPCVTDMRLGAPAVRPADDEMSTVAFAFLGLTLTLAEDLDNPFA